MENITKALLMAAGMFLAILILSGLVLFYNEISAYYAEKSEMAIIEQTQKFNAKFEGYNRKHIRGSDLISFMNRVIDYNASQSYNNEKNYGRIRVTITLGGNDIINQFKYSGEAYANKYLTSTITNTSGSDYISDKALIAITNTSNELCNEAKSFGIHNLTDGKLQLLASGISNIMANDTLMETWAVYNRLKRADLIEDILGLKVNDEPDANIRIDMNDGKVKSGNTTLNGIKEITSKYYQYMQFKRAYFDCTEMIYDTETNRVVEMKFQVQTKSGIVVFD